jgi:hypothetical protein
MGYSAAGPRPAFALALSLALALFLAPACSHARHEATSPPEPLGDSADVALEIDNHNWLDVTIYVLHDGQPTRIGIANASSSASFTFPARLLGQGREIRLFARPIGGAGAASTETVVVQPGQYIEWVIESNLERSAIGVY